jgi:hypothetical protein
MLIIRGTVGISVIGFITGTGGKLRRVEIISPPAVTYHEIEISFILSRNSAPHRRTQTCSFRRAQSGLRLVSVRYV